MRVLGIIPARGGSKGIKRKNIAPLAGKPLIAWTIEAARESGVFDCLVVSTDSEEIAEVARHHGGEVPFMRPAALATDTASAFDAFLHCFDELEKRGHAPFDVFFNLQPTSPLRRAEDILGALSIFKNKDAKAVVSVCPVEHPPFWTNVLPPDGCMKDFLDLSIALKNRQELPQYYRLNGAVFCAQPEYYRQRRGWYGDRTFAYAMPNERSVDIDAPLDLAFAEFLLLRSREHRKDSQSDAHSDI